MTLDRSLTPAALSQFRGRSGAGFWHRISPAVQPLHRPSYLRAFALSSKSRPLQSYGPQLVRATGFKRGWLSERIAEFSGGAYWSAVQLVFTSGRDSPGAVTRYWAAIIPVGPSRDSPREGRSRNRPKGTLRCARFAGRSGRAPYWVAGAGSFEIRLAHRCSVARSLRTEIQSVPLTCILKFNLSRA